MLRSFRFYMQDSTGETTPPDTRPSFGPRLRAFLASVLGLRRKYSEPFPTSSGEPEWVTEARSRKDFPRQVLDEQFRMLHVERKEERARRRAAENRADMLNAAIQFACSGECPAAEHWLRDWNEGDEDADDELRAWMETENGKTVLGAAMVGRNGVQPVSPPVGRERPEPATVQPTGPKDGYLYAPDVPTSVPFYSAPLKCPQSDAASWARASMEIPPSQINPAYVDLARAYGAKHGDVKIGYGVTCWELGGWVPHPKALQARPDAYIQEPGSVAERCILCCDGEDLPIGEYCRGCGRTNP